MCNFDFVDVKWFYFLTLSPIKHNVNNTTIHIVVIPYPAITDECAIDHPLANMFLTAMDGRVNGKRKATYCR